MFFRRERTKQLTFEDQMTAARAAGFRTESIAAGKTRIERNGIAAVVEPAGGIEPEKAIAIRFTERAGVMMGAEIGTLTDGGFQKFFTTPSGKRKPALAEELKEIHNFQEDLRQALNLTTLYNEALGTVSNLYLYDRVEGRDSGDNDKPWQVR